MLQDGDYRFLFPHCRIQQENETISVRVQIAGKQTRPIQSSVFSISTQLSVLCRFSVLQNHEDLLQWVEGNWLEFTLESIESGYGDVNFDTVSLVL
jgi:hypothetical protein